MKSFFCEAVVPGLIAGVCEIFCVIVAVWIAFEGPAFLGVFAGAIMFFPFAGLFLLGARDYKRELEPSFQEYFGRFLAQIMLMALVVVGFFTGLQQIASHVLR